MVIQVYQLRMITSMMCVLLIFGGCIAVSQSPSSRFYLLEPIEESSTSKALSTKKLLIGIGPVMVPDYLNRPQMVTRKNDSTLQFAEFDRWAQVLDLALPRLIRDNLNMIKPESTAVVYPWNPTVPVQFRVSVEIIKLDSVLSDDLTLIAQWMIIDVQHIKTVKIGRTIFKNAIAPAGYSGLAKTLSLACAQLSRDIADAFNDMP